MDHVISKKRKKKEKENKSDTFFLGNFLGSYITYHRKELLQGWINVYEKQCTVGRWLSHALKRKGTRLPVWPRSFKLKIQMHGFSPGTRLEFDAINK